MIFCFLSFFYDSYIIIMEIKLISLLIRLCLKLDSPYKADKLQCLSTLKVWLNSLFKSKPEGISACLPFVTVYLSQRLLNFIQCETDAACKVVATDTLCKFIRHLMEVAPTQVELYAVELNTCLICIIKDNESKVGRASIF